MNVKNLDSSFNVPSSSIKSSSDTSSVKQTQIVEQAKSSSEPSEKNEGNINKQELTETVDKLNSQMVILGTDLKFGYNDELNVMYVNVYEKSSGDLIRKFPTEKAMKLAEHMQEFVGMLFDKKG